VALKFGRKEWFVFVILILLVTDLAIILNIPFIRQIVGFLFLTILPGLLILQILKLDKIDLLEKFILAWGLSISFLMLFGLLVNSISLGVGYKTPLATTPLLILFNLAFVVFMITGYKWNKNATFSLPDLKLSTSEKAFLTVPILFPALSIFGMLVMNTTDNNSILMLLLFLIPIYVTFVCFFNHKFPKRLYPVVIFSIGISLLLLMSLRSNHIIGIDAHLEYYFFRTTLNNLYWSAFGHSLLDACLSISLLPAIYQSILNMNTEFLYKILYSSLFSVFPLAIYVLSKRYIGELYGFLASCFSMFQVYFLVVAFNPRTSVAVLFFALAMMTLFSEEINPLKKRILFIVFMTSCILSHYSTTYIFFIIMFIAFVGVEILSKKYSVKMMLNLTLTCVFFSLIFFWYSQVTTVAFNDGIRFVGKTVDNLNMFFIMESRSDATPMLLGEGIIERSIAHRIEFILTWLMFAFISIGIITLLRRYKEMSFPEPNFKKPKYLKKKFGVEYFMITLACACLLVAMIILPYLAVGYDIMRLYSLTTTILSVFFVIGGILIAKKLSLIKEALPKNPHRRKKNFTERSHDQRNNGENTSQVRVYVIILLVLIPYFLCVTNVIYNMAGVPRSILLNSKGENYEILYIHDEEVIAANWLNENNVNALAIYGDSGAPWRLDLECEVGKKPTKRRDFFAKNMTIDNGYIYLRHLNVVEGKVNIAFNIVKEITGYLHLFVVKNEIYDNGYSEIWMAIKK
jgi:uncharacterized membrane protein